MKYFTSDVLNLTTSYIKTTKNLPEFLDSLDKIGENLFKESSVIYDTLFENISYDMKSYIQDVLKISGVGRSELKEIISELKQEVPNIHQVKFVLAFQPLPPFVDVLFLWVSSNLGKDLLVNYEVNPQIIGGVIIIYKGKYLDYSSAPLISKYFEAHTSDVQTLLN